MSSSSLGAVAAVRVGGLDLEKVRGVAVVEEDLREEEEGAGVVSGRLRLSA